jgi:HrpA-like RNA helicase
MAVAERVSAERGEVIGGTVGYRVRFESASSKATRLVFATPGVLLRKLWGDALLEEFSHVILDEVHEEDRDTELLLVVLRQLVLKRAGTLKPLKLVLMSATLAGDKLERWFASTHEKVPRLLIGGSAHPVTTFFLGDVNKPCLSEDNEVPSKRGEAGPPPDRTSRRTACSLKGAEVSERMGETAFWIARQRGFGKPHRL